MHLNRERARQIVQQFSRKRVLVVGDVMLDQFIWGSVSRISPEAPVPVVEVTGESFHPGGAANAARNLRPFTDGVFLLGRAGKDAEAASLRRILEEEQLDTSALIEDGAAPTAVKTRVIARHQQVVRIDREKDAPPSEEAAKETLAQLNRIAASIDAVVVADYAKGFVTQKLAGALSRLASEKGVLLAVDPHPSNRVTWKGAAAMKPNSVEASVFAGVPHRAVRSLMPGEPVFDIGAGLLKKWACGMVLITLGEQGMLLFREDRAPFHVPAVAREVFDVSGAGDTAIAILTLALAAGAAPEEAALLANHASGVVVGKLGTATLTPGELLASVPE